MRTDDAPLSERLLIAADAQGEISYDAMDCILREAAELARRVEAAPVAEVDVDEFLAAYPVDYSDNYDAIMSIVGIRVRLVPETP